ncbi:Eco57I restriction-modification methylase domain-containing protein [Fodinibius sp.]|uniref:Eco57I restriction-modification methylase domain-containing protein n=1 Tax=Fodinibius sp. TaxID=1872440 RepID=UPI002ACE0752|nr:Eco57I restriction-modification methylase domain-containing protein [Fodinibius sp.]MDZ7659500.1 Eco57I restriction-modification methylase domain-containing protein [Fodinibius sp.]
MEDGLEMPVYNRSKIRNRDGDRLKGEKLSALEYLLRFLDAYNFNTEGTAEVQKEAKTLINASVLGRIFEKINGYKDGSFFTPGYITEYMCRETIRRAVVQKFNETYDDWECETIDDVAAKISRHEVPYDKANEVVNSITICDPAVGSGHFLVSALNELIAVKSDLRIFVDEDNHRIRDVEISVDNDELSIAVGQDPFFEYRVHSEWKENGTIERTVGPDTQRLQKALFREKNILIENCLFGVDINPNSVNICRLRLWIELLKHAYYKESTDFQQLEVLPNIDINIKQGNSLVSRFDLDADLSQILANNDDLTIEEYKQAVRSYKETGDQADKRALKEQINSIKESFSVGLKELHPVRQKLKKQRELLVKEEAKLDLFEGDKKSKKEQKKIKKTKKKIAKLEDELEELENATFFDQAFEWRFEFPEVLDEDGNFTGFDAVIGNPPYGTLFTGKLDTFLREKFKTSDYQINSFSIFVELSKSILNTNSYCSFIILTSWIGAKYDQSFREFILNELRIKKVTVCPKNTFEDAVVETLILLYQKAIPAQEFIVNHIKNIDDVKKFETKDFVEESHKIFPIHLSRFELRLIKKIQNNTKRLDDIAEVVWGVKVYEKGKGTPPQKPSASKNKIFHSNEKENDTYLKVIGGRDIDRYEINFKDKYLSIMDLG